MLAAAAGLPRLRALDLANQLLTGQLPAAVAFPALQTLRVTNNLLTVRASHTANLRSLHVTAHLLVGHACRSIGATLGSVVLSTTLLYPQYVQWWGQTVAAGGGRSVSADSGWQRREGLATQMPTQGTLQA